MLIGEDFNARTGEKGGTYNGEEEEGYPEIRGSIKRGSNC